MDWLRDLWVRIKAWFAGTKVKAEDAWDRTKDKAGFDDTTTPSTAVADAKEQYADYKVDSAREDLAKAQSDAAQVDTVDPYSRESVEANEAIRDAAIEVNDAEQEHDEALENKRRAHRSY